MADARDNLDDTEALKVPPNSIEAEQAVLGGLMVDNEAWDQVADRVGEVDFYRRDHRLLFRAMGSLAEAGQPMDVVTLSEWLKSNGELEDAGGLPYLGALAKDTPSSANIRAYADIVREKSVLRRLIEAGTEVARTGYVPEGRDSGELLDNAERLIFEIAEQSGRHRQGFSSVREILPDVVDRIDTLYHLEGDVTGLPTGFSDFDRMTSGLQEGDFMVVAGRPSMGKCLAHDAEIMLDDGRVATIEQLCRSREGRVGTLRDDLKLDRAHPSHYVDDGYKPVFEVSTQLGRRVETTLPHPFLTPQGWKPLSQIEVGEHVAVPRRLPVFGDQAMRECEVKLLAYFIGDGGLTGTSPRFTSTNPAIQRDFTAAVQDFGGVDVKLRASGARAPSYPVADAHSATGPARAAFAPDVDHAVMDSGLSARALADELGVAPASVSYWRRGANAPKPSMRRRLADVLDTQPLAGPAEASDEARRNCPNPLRLWLAEMGLAGQGAHDKQLPASVFTLPREQLALFLNRLFATDGWASLFGSGQAQVGYASVNERLSREVQHLLLRFGIIAKLRQRWVRYGDARRPSWQLDITHPDAIAAFAEEIGIHGKEQAIAEVLAVVRSKRPQSNTDHVPAAVWHQIDAARGNWSWSELARHAGIADANPHPYRRGLSRQRLAKFALALQSPELMALADSDVYWDRVESVTALGDKQVYDLTIPDTHNFVANDVCVHNTTFAMNIAESASLQSDQPVAVFSMEMPGDALAMRMLSSLGRVELQRIRSGRLSDDDWPRLTSTMNLLSQANMFIDDTAGLTPTDMRARARRLKREHGLGLIVIDYIQLMQLPGFKENRATEISEISRGLKGLAKELGVPVVALSQLNRSLEQRPNKRPIMSDLRESGAIEQDADIITFIYRDEVYNEDSPDHGVAEIIIGKQRNGPVGTVRLTFLGQYTRFENHIDDRYGDEAYT